MHGRRLGKGGRNPFGSDELDVNPIVVGRAFLSSSNTNGASLFEA